MKARCSQHEIQPPPPAVIPSQPVFSGKTFEWRWRNELSAHQTRHTLIYSMPSRQQLRVNHTTASHCPDKISRLRQAKVFGRSYFYNCVSLCKIPVPGHPVIEETGLSAYTVMVEVCWTLGCVCANNKQPVRRASTCCVPMKRTLQRIRGRVTYLPGRHLS